MKTPLAGLLAAALLAAPLASAQSTTRVSVTAAGAQVLNGGSEEPSLSATGRFVAFYSSAPGLVPGDSNNIDDVFVRDRQLGTIERVSVSTAGAAGNGDSDFPSISADGRYVAFRSAAFNFDPADADPTQDIYVRDRLAGTTTLVSKDSAGVAAPFGHSSYPSISADGHFVAFESLSKDLVPEDTNGVSDIFVHELLTGMTYRVSLMNVSPPPPDKNQATGPSYYASISGNGRFVAFGSDAGNLVAGDTNGQGDIFVRDRLLASTTRVSLGPAGVQADDDCSYPTLSDDGAFVVFQTKATNLVTGDTNNQTDVFVAAVATTVAERVSVSTARVQSNFFSNYADMSGDGRFVVFASAGNTLVAGNTNSAPDVFLHDRQTHVTTRSTVSTSGAQADKGGQAAAVSDDGLVVGFQSESTNLVPADTNDRSDVFVRDALGCNGAGGWTAYGAGLAGAGGFVPSLLGTGCPLPGALITLHVEHAVGGAGGTLFVGLGPAALPFKGGSLLVSPILQAVIGVGGTPGAPGAGGLVLPALLPATPTLSGVSLFLQAAFSDAAAVKDVSLTQGLEMEIG
jgi:Tol biopolymer transport system component